MLSTDAEDMDQIPVKMLNTLDALSTFNYDFDNELAWADSIERNVQDVVNKLEENKDDPSSSSIIDVNVEDYLRLFPKIPDQIHRIIPKIFKKSKQGEAHSDEFIYPFAC